MAKRGGGITLRGAAAGAFIEAQMGRKAETDDEMAMRIATLVYMNMSNGGDQRAAVALVKAVASRGLKEAADICTARRDVSG